MLEIIGAGASGKATKDWSLVWKDSQEAKSVQTEIDHIHDERALATSNKQGEAQVGEYAMPFMYQLWYVTHRSFQGFWREPSYVWAKIMLGTLSSLFIGFTFFKVSTSTLDGAHKHHRCNFQYGFGLIGVFLLFSRSEHANWCPSSSRTALCRGSRTFCSAHSC